MTSFEIDYDGNIHYEDYQQKMYNTCWQELINDGINTTNNYCDCVTKSTNTKKSRTQKEKKIICNCKSPNSTKRSKK